MEFSTFDVVPKRKRINVFKVGKLWLFKQFFENKECFQCITGPLQQRSVPVRVQIHRARNNALKLLERNDFDYDLVEDLKGYVVKLPKFAKYAQILKNSVATKGIK